jgi:hypothetical protein
MPSGFAPGDKATLQRDAKEGPSGAAKRALMIANLAQPRDNENGSPPLGPSLLADGGYSELR